MNYKEKLNELLLTAAQQKASDLHITVGRRPTLRIDGTLISLQQEPILTPEDTQGLTLSLLNPVLKDKLMRQGDVDFTYAFEDKARFRTNVYFQRGFLAAALRLIPAEVLTIDELRLPPLLRDFTNLSQGFVLVVGPAGQGKSTTLASMLNEINHKRASHIVTVEDPIEYLFVQDKSIVSQREVLTDSPNFHRAIRSILRQDPDVLMIGEMRDRESIATAMTAAETGHLVFSTLHTNSAEQTIDRIVDSFPTEQQNQIASQLAATLTGIVSQRLVPKIGGGRVPACELMFANAAIKNLIREKKFFQIDLVIETSLQDGMITLNRSLAELVKKKEVSLEMAEKYSLNPSELRLLLERI